MATDSSRRARILVLYFSREGNTKMMADLVAAGASIIPATDIRIKSVIEFSK